MSALSSILSSIGGAGEQPSTDPKPTSISLKPVTNGSFKAQSKSAPTTPTANVQQKPVYKGTAGLSTGLQQGNTLKRKAEEVTTNRPVKLSKTTFNVLNSSDRIGQKSKTQSGESRSTMSAKSTNVSNQVQSVPPPFKAPAKGSYAEMMARAKEAAQTKTPSQVGLIKHQATEKLKASKAADRRKGEPEKPKTGTGPSNKSINGKSDPRRRSVSPIKTTKKTDLTAPKPAKIPQPPLHAPARAQGPSYKGTLGQGNKRAREEIQRKKSKYDDYLGTDEEDEDEYGSYGDDDDDLGGHSDASSDMEGGFDDLELEERRTLQAAKEDDARELALENKLKREKLERQRKLAALAAKRK